jgi:catechol 2,3-dioxygenase-like lactoylglutathione lyase family enzyme
MASAHHHVALRVADMERGVRFYEEALGARQLSKPFLLEGRFSEQIWAHARARVLISQLGFDEGAIELFQFLEPARPTGALDQVDATLMHMAFRVDSVHEVVRRVEAAGGQALFPVMPWGDVEFVYCRDPDGNVLELTQADMPHIVRLTLEAFPEAAP